MVQPVPTAIVMVPLLVPTFTIAKSKLELTFALVSCASSRATVGSVRVAAVVPVSATIMPPVI